MVAAEEVVLAQDVRLRTHAVRERFHAVGVFPGVEDKVMGGDWKCPCHFRAHTFHLAGGLQGKRVFC